MLAIVVALGAGAAGAAALIPDRPPRVLQAGSDVLAAPVLPDRFDDRRTVPVVLAITEATPLVANAAGRITAQRVVAGQTIESGSSPVDIDGAPVLALHTGIPLYRDLGVESTGADVTALHDELIRLGYRVDRAGYYGVATSAAIKNLKTLAGAVKPDGELPLAQTLWLPADSVVPHTWTARLGSDVQGGGSYGQLRGELTSMTATLPDSRAPGARMLTLWGRTAAIDTAGRTDDPGVMRAVMGTAEYAATVASPDRAAALTGIITLTEPLPVLKVPPTALFGISGSAACLQSGAAVFPVTIVGSGLGASLVVLSDPAENPPTEAAVGPGITAEGCR